MDRSNPDQGEGRRNSDKGDLYPNDTGPMAWTKKIESLIRLGADLSRARHESEVVERLIRGLHQTLHYDSIELFMLHTESGERVLVGSIGRKETGKHWRLAPGEGISERAIVECRLQYTADVRREPEYIPGLGTGAEVDVPIIVDEKAVGVLVIESAQPDSFDETDFSVLTALANLTGLALERARKQEAVEDAESRYRSIFEGLHDAVVVQSLDGQLLDVNARACEMYGWDREKLLGMTVEDLAPPDQLNLSAEDFLSGQAPTQPVESINIRADGEEFPVEISARLAAIEGVPVMLVVIRDISERRRVVQALKESEARFRTLVEHAPEAIVVFDTDTGNFVNANQNAVEMFGYERHELFKLSPVDVSPAVQPNGQPSSKEVRRYVEAALEGETPIFEWTHLDASGREIPCEIRLVRLPAAGRRLVRGSVTDISMRKQAEARLRQSEARYRSLFNRLPIGLYRTSPDGEIDEVNSALLEMMKCEDLDEFHRQYPSTDAVYANPEDRQRWKEILDQEGVVFGFETKFMRWDGSVLWARDSARVVRDEAGNTLHYEGSVEDITEQKMAEEALRQSEERYALAAAAANDGLWDWDVESGDIYFSERWLSMCGCFPDEGDMSIEFWFDRVHPDDRKRLQHSITDHLQGNSDHFECEYRLRHARGEDRWMLARGLAVFNSNGLATRMAGSQTDITSRKQAEEKLLHDALHDSLTGLPNRALFIDRLTQSMARLRRFRSHRFAVLFLDLDRFKVINDSLGHAVGDELLIAVGERLGNVVREMDTVARFGGDEFAILLDESGTKEEAIGAARRIEATLQKPFELSDSEVFTSASVGIALSSAGYNTVEHMLRDADIAMYRAKGGDKGYEIFSPTMHLNTVRAYRLETELRRAVKKDEFELHYQPIVSLANGAVGGFEALLRWRHPQEGLISAGEFISLAEETGMIKDIGRHVLYEACRQLRAWQKSDGPHDQLFVSVNVSNKQVLDPSLIQDVINVLEKTDINPNCLKLEMTESLIVGDDKGTKDTIQNLSALGIELYLDDFGTGYSSLNMVHRFPIRALKIDYSFIKMLDADDENVDIVKTIVALAKSLSVPVIAEGVESRHQLKELRRLGSDFAQGFLFAKALPAADARRFLEDVPWAGWF